MTKKFQTQAWRIRCALVALWLALGATGCQWSRPGGANLPSPEDDANAAALINPKALDAFKRGDLSRAESALREALKQDPLFGPAHNNLGVVLFKRNQHYEAAQEFEIAARMMSQASEPLHNLGLVYEAVGRYHTAAEYYEAALKRFPDDLPAMESLGRVLVRMGDTSARLGALLDEVALREPDAQWREWAMRQAQRLKAGQSSSGEADGPPAIRFDEGLDSLREHEE